MEGTRAVEETEKGMDQEATGPQKPARRLRADKREAIMDGGREVFAREGYARASIDAIATAAGVSTRTVYKHFADKSALFTAVITSSAAQIADEETALIRRHLSPSVRAGELDQTLERFATQWLTGTKLSASHRALIGQVHAEAAHLGPEVITAWWEAGPGRVLGELSAALGGLHEAGLLRILDAERAAAHLSELIAATPGPPGTRLTRARREEWIAAGVRVFVRGYRG